MGLETSKGNGIGNFDVRSSINTISTKIGKFMVPSTAYRHSSMLQLVGYGTSLVRNTKLRVLASERVKGRNRKVDC